MSEAATTMANKRERPPTTAAISSHSPSPVLEIPLSSTPNVRKCRLVRRYKRFLADVVFPEDDDGSDEPESFVTVHCPNTGPMTGLLDSCPRAEAWVSVADDPSNKRKYKHTLEAIRPTPSEAIVGVHSAAANRVVRALLESGVLSEGGRGEGRGGGADDGEFPLLPRLADGDGSIAAEVSYGKRKKAPASSSSSPSAALSRADFLLQCGDERGGELLLEVKSVTLAEADASRPRPPGGGGRLALFPDTVSLRAQRHCRDLEDAATSPGNRRAAIVFLIQREDCDSFSPSERCDPEYARALRSAASAGVAVLAVRGEVAVASGGEGGGGLVFRYLGRARVDLDDGAEREGREKGGGKGGGRGGARLNEGKKGTRRVDETR